VGWFVWRCCGWVLGGWVVWVGVGGVGGCGWVLGCGWCGGVGGGVWCWGGMSDVVGV
jgi:hypothetical protein